MKPKELLAQIVPRLESDMAEGELLPKFFIYAQGELSIIAGPFINDEVKNAISAIVKGVVKKLHAEWVVFVSEAYTLETTDKKAIEEYQNNPKKYPTLADFPGSVEVVMLNLETRSDGCHMGMARISKDRKMG